MYNKKVIIIHIQTYLHTRTYVIIIIYLQLQVRLQGDVDAHQQRRMPCHHIVVGCSNGGQRRTAEDSGEQRRTAEDDARQRKTAVDDAGQRRTTEDTGKINRHFSMPTSCLSRYWRCTRKYLVSNLVRKIGSSSRYIKTDFEIYTQFD